MKKAVVILLVICLLPLYAMPVSAETEGGYMYEVQDGEAFIFDWEQPFSGAVTIPSELGGYPVTRIRDGFFKNMDGITSVRIPGTIKTIGSEMFRGCDGLKQVTISSGTEVIGYSAFAECPQLTSVSIPGTVKRIENSAFYQCFRLTSVTLPEGLNTIGTYSFYACNSLSSVTISSAVSSIGDDAFLDCERLTGIQVSSVNSAYSSIDGVLFNKDKSVLICYPNAHSGASYSIPTGVQRIERRAFHYASKLTAVTIPNTVTTIGEQAFSNCFRLTSISVPDSVTQIGIRAFSPCIALEQVKLPAGLTEISYELFSGDYFLSSVTIPAGVTSIGERAFDRCSRLTEIYFNGGAPQIASDAFNKVTATALYYPGDSWTESVMQDYGGDIIWTDRRTGHAHKFGEFVETKAPTCKEKGIKTATCQFCDITKTEEIPIPVPVPHTFGNLVSVNENQHKDVCSVCKQEITQEHTWDGGKVTKKATCLEEGSKLYTCTGCKHTKTEVIEKLDHKYGTWVKVDANTHRTSCTTPGCTETKTENHKYNTSWSKDKDQHWHECSVCKDKKDTEVHKPGPEATEKDPQTCTVCKYIITPALGHEHAYEEKWTTDEKGHWHTCPGCEEKGSYADHDFENACDKDCSVCGFTRETEHVFAETWTGDAENHWHACTGCGLKQDEAAHEPGPAATEETAQTCTICGYEIAPALGGGEEPVADQTDGANAPGFPWVIVAVAGIVALGAILFFTLKKKK